MNGKKYLLDTNTIIYAIQSSSNRQKQSQVERSEKSYKI